MKQLLTMDDGHPKITIAHHEPMARHQEYCDRLCPSLLSAMRSPSTLLVHIQINFLSDFVCNINIRICDGMPLTVQFLFLLACVDALPAIQQFFSHVRIFPGLNQY